ncbi:MAG: acetyl-coenzyme A synthetase N-terminal domain-containing protein, partial [Casimicrobiaceae bacterium]
MGNDTDRSRAAIAACAEFHRRSIDDRDAFWREEAQLVDWHAPFAEVLDPSRPPFA